MAFSRLQFKTLIRQVFKPKPGGPTDVTRAQPVINLLDRMVDEFAMGDEIPAGDQFTPIAEDQYGTHEPAATLDQALAYLYAQVANGTAVTIPARPTGALVDDTGNTFSVLLVPGYDALAEYQGFGFPGVAGTVPLTTANAYLAAGRVYLKNLTGPIEIGAAGIGVAASGNRPAGPFATNAQPFTGPVVLPEPTITSFSPASGAPGTSITINGTNFTGATSVRFGATPAASFTVLNATTAIAAVPALAAGSYRPSITTSSGTGTAGVDFTVQTTVKDLQFIVDGNSISTEDYAAGWHATLEAAVAVALESKTPAQLTAAGLTGGVSFDWNGISGQTSADMNSAAQDIDGQFDAAKRNVVLTIGEPFNTFRPPYQTTTAQQGADSFNTYCLNRKAAHPALGIVALLGFPDNYNGSDPTFNPPRADFAQVMSDCISILQAKKNAGTAGFDVLALVDPIFDSTKSELAADGVHPTTLGYGSGGNLINRLVAGIMQYLFGTAQPAPVQPSAGSGNYASGATAISYPTQVNQIIQAGVITSAATEPGYGSTGVSGSKMPAGGTAWVGTKIVGSDARDAIVGLHTANTRVPYAQMSAAFWRNSIDNKLYVIDGAGNPYIATGVTATVGMFLRLYRAGSVLKLQSSTNGTSWADVYTYTYSSSADLYLVSDIEKSGKLYYPQGAGLALATADTNVTLLPGATAITFASSYVQQSGGRIVATTGRPFGSYGGAALAGLKLAGDGYIAMKLAQPDAFDAVLGLKANNNITPDVDGNFYPSFQAGIWNASYDPSGGDGKFLYAFDNGTAGALNQTGTLGLFARLRRAGTTIYAEISTDDGASWTIKRTYNYSSSAPLYVAIDISGPGTMYYPQGVGLTAA